MCGNGHYSMKGLIEVVTQEEYDAWMAKQKPYYFAAFPEKDPSNTAPTDSTAKRTAGIPTGMGSTQNKLK